MDERKTLDRLIITPLYSVQLCETIIVIVDLDLPFCGGSLNLPRQQVLILIGAPMLSLDAIQQSR